MTEPVVLTSLENDTLTITLNRPQRLNALNPELLDAFDKAFEQLEPTTRAVILRGSGRAFSAGHDLKWSAEQADQPPMTEDEMAATTDRLHEITRRIRACPIPVVSRVHGYAIGGGAEIALSADLVVADSSAVFRFTETAVGLVVTNGFTAVMPRTAGPVVAKEIILLGEPFTGEQARTWGLVNRVVAEADLDDEIAAIVRSLKLKSPTALRLAKNLLDQAWEGTTEEIMRRETLASVEASLGPDAKEAAAAFAEGRDPRFAPRTDTPAR
ncbi:enoyl-CoA hydratase/isomerase family protein [Amycolatopsis sp. Poz14]|uniref:enoyl-CoA hydratase/isomerase family protein n=1 Tax=Amycolatopsis sp. Poz14 TaxID=1447705 RepID=UPI001EE90C35|nr:enoyl-CoA hydratase/isomerase family protein [Amycolatopsis sp. Poz14]MCG3751965.1 enoyl-CoA hydratase/isomerase family protein [Amycolatopsis sp. Poz14]